MPQEIAGGFSMEDAQSWAATLTTMINSGAFKGEKAGWIGNMSTSDAVASAMEWASDSNAFVCSVVIPKGASAYTGMELDGAYFKSAEATIELQIAKG